MWYHWGALMINQFKGRDVLIFGGGEAGGGTEVLAYYSLDKQNECARSTAVLERMSLKKMPASSMRTVRVPAFLLRHQAGAERKRRSY